MTGEQLLIKTIKQCNAFEARVKYLESDEYVKGIKFTGIEEFIHFVIETGELSGSDNKFMWDFAKELRNN